MLFLYKTSSGVFCQQAVDLLERHGIEVHVKELPDQVGPVGIMSASRSEYDIHVCNDADFALAKQLLIGIGADNPPPVRLPGERAMSLLIALGLCALAAGLYFFDNG